VAAGLFAVISLVMAGPVARFSDVLAGALGLEAYNAVLLVAELLGASGLAFFLAFKIRSRRERTAAKLGLWALWVGAVILAEHWNTQRVEHVHYLQYGVLGALLWPVFRGRWRLLGVLALGCGVGLLDEALQGVTKGRVFDWADAVYNVLGVVGGALYVWSVSRGGGAKASRAERRSPGALAGLCVAVLLGGASPAAADPPPLPDPAPAIAAFGALPEWLGRHPDPGGVLAVRAESLHALARPLDWLSHLRGIAGKERARTGWPSELISAAAAGEDPRATAPEIRVLGWDLTRDELVPLLGQGLVEAIDEVVLQSAQTRRGLQLELARAFTVAERELLERGLRQVYLPAREAGVDPAALALLQRVGDARPLWPRVEHWMLWRRAVQKLVLAGRGAVPRDGARGLGAEPGSCARGDVLATIWTQLGPLVIGGPGRTEYRCEDPLLLLDLGGDDVYHISARDLSAWQRLPVTAIVDLAGDDRYLGQGPGVLGGGFFGYSILIDAAGDDVYVAEDIALGAAVVGVGLLVDHSGVDSYRGRFLTQGAAVLGGATLWDGGGNDRYSAGNFGQGAGGLRGAGDLIDLSGNDEYSIGGRVADFREPDQGSVSYGQGYGFGHRELGLAGGAGSLFDLAGHDTYRASYFGQGAATFFGLGVLYDAGVGDDRYLARRYVQGAGVHMGAGFLVDEAGDDLYEALGVAQGCGHDLAVGLLVDGAGNDRYDAGFLAQGAARAEGLGILLDGAGQDRYWAGPQGTQGAQAASEDPRRPSVGLLLELKGRDFYTGKGRDGTVWRDAPGRSGGADLE